MIIRRRIVGGFLIARLMIDLTIHPRRRALFREMRSFLRDLPDIMQQPLPMVVQQVASSPAITNETETTIRQMADVAALIDRTSPLGHCLRQSMTRYRFLRPIDLPLVVHFGMRLVAGTLRADREISGHAWLTLNGEPYHEVNENWQGFTIMWSYPETK